MTPDILDRSPTAACSDLPGQSSPSGHDRLRGAILIGLSVAVGAVAWSGIMVTLPVATILPLLWAQSPSRLVAAAVSAAYFLAASRGLPQGVANFYAADLWPGLLLWAMASVGFTIVHAVLWTGHPEKKRGARYLLAMVLTGVPPFGIAGWAHPLTAAGVLFPGWGWFGIGATAILLVLMTGRRWQIAVAVLLGLYAWSATDRTQPKVPERWKGVDLALGQNLGRDDSLSYHRNLIAAVRAKAGEARFVVLPESALGFWTPTVARVWQHGLLGSGITVIAGAAVIDAAGYDNVMVAISANEARILYRERMPVPGSMWQPWRVWMGKGGGARAHFIANPVVEVAGMRIAPLICYEELIFWPILQSMLHAPDIIVATGNGWWTSGTSIIGIQQTSASSWSRLFAVPIVMAFNQNPKE
ncbi:conjugal transfer protein TraB (plasmid) [Rhizobium sp. K1/93]|nr:MULTISPECIES: conjugal transfer protein TraB [unclassified Rhizobium]QXZ88292.1 conjugal transfer protein TraB [Rhizobium sp. K1/93]QXZ94263.1 conjugal transfer protein TraB [Rhizobium sp. K15/93]QYA05647.1 conjugal transfer protein TraB [Rhizobium sp. B21/90]MBO9101900.1 conjugal transfer protein TraB [Rhizobium sp. L58/93]MBO9172071.1 conjugal transfer protein TraB [Rhizobium sp. L245/93]